ncbi:MAG: LPXTG cell wall anchor domain-containing protein, partial [Clostridia bacterium]|nr:LPXTG cell wall anchor domain-containing protein [Clostridia bacterium]
DPSTEPTDGPSTEPTTEPTTKPTATVAPTDAPDDDDADTPKTGDNFPIFPLVIGCVASLILALCTVIDMKRRKN